MRKVANKQTNKQTDKQTNTDESISSLAEVSKTMTKAMTKARRTMTLTGVLRSKIEMVHSPAGIRDTRQADGGRDKTNSKRHVTADVPSRNQTSSW